MIKFSFNILLVVSLFMVGCKGSEKTPETAKTASEQEVIDKKVEQAVETIPSNCYEVTVGSNALEGFQYSEVNIKKSAIVGKEFHVTCVFSGCPADELYFAWNGAMKKSYPGQVTIALGYNQSGMCESMITRDYCFQITSLNVNDKVYIKVNNGEMLLYEPSKK